MDKKKLIYLLLAIVVIVIAITANNILHPPYLAWKYSMPQNQKIVYLDQNETYLFVCTTNKNKTNYFLNVLTKEGKKLIYSLTFTKKLSNPVVTGDKLIIATCHEKHNINGYIQIFNLDTGEFIKKIRYYSRFWNYYVFDNYLYFVNENGQLVRLDLNSKKGKLKILSDENFENSLMPEYFRDYIYICNLNKLIIIDNDTFKVNNYLNLPAKAISSKYSSGLGIILNDNDELICLDLITYKALWKFKFVSLFSQSTFEIINNEFLAILNTIDFTNLRMSKRAKHLRKVDSILYLFKLQKPQGVLQKTVKHAFSIDKPYTYSSLNTIVLTDPKDNLSVYNLYTGQKIWNFNPKFNKIKSLLTYILYNKVIFIFSNNKKYSNVFVLNLFNGKYINKLDLPICKHISLPAIIDEKNLYITCNHNQIVALKLNKLIKKK